MEPDQVVAGVDGAREDHAVAVVDATGRAVERFTVTHTGAGLRELIGRLRADWLTPKRVASFLAGIRYCGSTTPEKMDARITAAPRGATGDVGGGARAPGPAECAVRAGRADRGVGVALSTRQSGKSRIVGFRWAVDRQLRDALVEWAGDSRLSNPWAADVYRRTRARGCDPPHAVRILARAWVYVLWRCWQDGTAYDPDRHAARQRPTLTV